MPQRRQVPKACLSFFDQATQGYATIDELLGVPDAGRDAPTGWDGSVGAFYSSIASGDFDSVPFYASRMEAQIEDLYSSFGGLYSTGPRCDNAVKRKKNRLPTVCVQAKNTAFSVADHAGLVFVGSEADAPALLVQFQSALEQGGDLLTAGGQLAAGITDLHAEQARGTSALEKCRRKLGI